MSNGTIQPPISPEVETPSQHSPIEDFYGPFVHLAIHGQENKWWMLYIYLLFNSILVLSCSTIIASQNFLFFHQIVLTLFCGAGFLVAICWIYMIDDYVNASNLYSNVAKEAEVGLPADIKKPFTIRDVHRFQKNPIGTMSFIATSLTILFVIIYIVLFVLTWSSLRSYQAL